MNDLFSWVMTELHKLPNFKMVGMGDGTRNCSCTGGFYSISEKELRTNTAISFMRALINLEIQVERNRINNKIRASLES